MRGRDSEVGGRFLGLVSLFVERLKFLWEFSQRQRRSFIRQFDLLGKEDVFNFKG